MKTHGTLMTIYHCLRCGRVVQTSAGGADPKCCSLEMVKAATELVPDSLAQESEPLEPQESGLSTPRLQR